VDGSLIGNADIGGYVQHQHEGIVVTKGERREYPFDDLASMLPWWGMIKAGKAAAKGRA
jgi:hypothetical protein